MVKDWIMAADAHVSRLPPRRLRPGGARSTDELWVQRGLDDARILADHAGLTETSRVLDWGSGPGRLLAGIYRLLGPIQSYTGIDVKADVIDWATTNLATPWTTFVHVDQSYCQILWMGWATHPGVMRRWAPPWLGCRDVLVGGRQRTSRRHEPAVRVRDR